MAMWTVLPKRGHSSTPRWTYISWFRTHNSSRCNSVLAQFTHLWRTTPSVSASVPSDDERARASGDVVCAVATLVGARPPLSSDDKDKERPGVPALNSGRWMRMGVATSCMSTHSHAGRARGGPRDVGSDPEPHLPSQQQRRWCECTAPSKGCVVVWL
jgi:hypothetical protein